MAGQLEGLQQVLRDFPADVIIGDQLMLGTFPMLLGPRSKRPAIVLLGTSYLIWRRDDGAPNEAGIPPASNEAQREEYAALFKESEAAVFGPVGRHLNDHLAALGVGPVSMNLYDAIVSLPDAYLQLTVPSFDCRDATSRPTCILSARCQSSLIKLRSRPGRMNWMAPARSSF